MSRITKSKRTALFALITVLFCSILPVYAGDAVGEAVPELPSPAKFDRTIYTEYLSGHSGAARPSASVEVDIYALSDSVNAATLDNVDGSKALQAGDNGFVEWNVNVAEEGLYNIYIEYYPLKSRGVDIERRVLINGEMPFAGADTIMLARVWTDSEALKQDNRGNDIRPSQAEAPRWEAAYFKDTMGYVTEPYQFFFKQGDNTLRLEAVNEPVAIRKLVLQNRKEPPAYQELLLDAASRFGNAPEGYINVIEGESAARRSSPTLFASYDRSSPGTLPYSIENTKINMTGGLQWRIAGQWIEWDIEVPADGLYHITLKNRQNYNRGNVSVRRLQIDGETPFREAEEVDLKFTSDWNMLTLSDEASGEPYKFPLTQGRHTLRLEITLGGMGEILSEAEQIVNRLTASYRKLLVLIGTTPDANRDYQVDKVYPDVMQYFADEIIVLDNFVKKVEAYTGQRGDQIASAVTLSRKLDTFIKKPERIPRSLTGFKMDIGALAAFILRMSESPLDIDSIVVSAPGAALPKFNNGFFARLSHEFNAFITSFLTDYSSIGNVYDNDTEPLDVWMLSGRDQSQSLKAIIDESFTPQYGISVNIRLIAPNVLLPSVVAGTGPDVALQVPGGEPVNYALRGSAVDLTAMPGFEEVKSEFFDSSFVPFKFDGGIYGLPETQGFPVLFYREDILTELEVEVPETWEDIIKILPVLQKNNMDFGLATDDVLNMYGMFLNMLYQRGGTVYNDAGSVSLLDTNLSVETFDFLTTMYTHYKLPKIYAFADRFRTGEMPVGVSDYSLFNQLSVSAPEIRGLWNFTLLPGFEDENGNIDHSSTGGGTCSMLLPDAENKDDAWTFLKWWIGADTQARYGRELEAIIGAAARYNTANVKAFEQLAWASDQRDVILEQWQWVVGTPEVPGGYYTSRHTLNALRRVMNNNEEPRETLLDYTRTINDELEKKRKEFGLTE
jgi:ABC-type glycerol-3-phosphate transport system substrate-binding protein